MSKDDDRAVAIGFTAAMLSNPAVIKRDQFRGDDGQTRSLLYQVWSGACYLAGMIRKVGKDLVFPHLEQDVSNDRPTRAGSRGKSTPGQNRGGKAGGSVDRQRRIWSSGRLNKAVRARQRARLDQGAVRAPSSARTTTWSGCRDLDRGSSINGQGTYGPQTGSLLRQGNLPQTQRERNCVKGYLIHLSSEWCGIRHVLVCATDEQRMLEEFYNMACSTLGRNATESRVVWCATTPYDWEEFGRRSLCELCTECTHGSRAA